MRVLLHSPKDTAAGAVAFAAVLAVIVNAMFLQHGRHPSPMFGGHVMLLQPATDAVAPPATTSSVVAPASPLPRPRPAGADRRSEVVPDEAPAPRGAQQGPQHATAQAADPIGHLVRKVAARSETPSGAHKAEAKAEHKAEHRGEAAPSRRVATVQRLLSDYGYGQLAPHGQVDAGTRAAIRKFELARHLPVTGQVSDRLVAELAAMTGHRID